MITNALMIINMDLRFKILQIMGETVEDEALCLRAAYKVANDLDGYEGMIFCRWTADAIGKAISINWEKFMQLC